MEASAHAPNNIVDGAVKLAPLSLFGDLVKQPVFVVVAVVPWLDVVGVKRSRSDRCFGLASDFFGDECPFISEVEVDETEKLVERAKIIVQKDPDTLFDRFDRISALVLGQDHIPNRLKILRLIRKTTPLPYSHYSEILKKIKRPV